MRTRIIAAAVAIPIVAVGVYFGGWLFFIGALAVALIAGWEFDHMMKAGGYHTTLFIILLLIALLLFDAFYPGLRMLPAIISLALLVSLVWQLTRHDEAPTANWALTLAGALYIGWAMGHLVALRGLADGLALVIITLLTTWASDTFAYFTGRAIGGKIISRKLWPRHSPKKTWEGMFGGIIGSIVIALIIAAFVPSFSWVTALLVGAIVPIAGFFGDISISMMKRDVGVKDSSHLFPGHGGFLDRIDSILFVSIVVYYLVIWVG